MSDVRLPEATRPLSPDVSDPSIQEAPFTSWTQKSTRSNGSLNDPRSMPAVATTLSSVSVSSVLIVGSVAAIVRIFSSADFGFR